MTKKTSMAWWIDHLASRVDSYVRLETSDGIRREGRLSGFGLRVLEFNGDRVDIITELELNGDPIDRIPLERVSKITAK